MVQQQQQGETCLGSYRLLYYPEGLPPLARAEDHDFWYALAEAAAAVAQKGEVEQRGGVSREGKEGHMQQVPGEMKVEKEEVVVEAAGKEHEQGEGGPTVEDPVDGLWEPKDTQQQLEEEEEREKEEEPREEGQQKRRRASSADGSGWGLAWQALLGAAALLFLPVLATLGVPFVLARYVPSAWPLWSSLSTDCPRVSRPTAAYTRPSGLYPSLHP